MNLEQLLKDYKNGITDLDSVKKELAKLPYEDLDFAKLDHHRKLRTGYGEVVYCSGKVTEHLVAVFKHFAEEGTNVLGSRASIEQYEAVRQVLPEVEYDPVSGIMKYIQEDTKHNTECELRENDSKENETKGTKSRENTSKGSEAAIGNICVCTGGTADVPVAEEAAQTAEFFGNHVTRIYDVGVAGIHRLLDNLETIQQANCIIAVAGMEGALPGVIAGLVQVPVIGVPTSVGYGTGYGGAAAILTMLNSCSNGIATVNIDNGFGAAYIASQINHQTVCGRL